MIEGGAYSSFTERCEKAENSYSRERHLSCMFYRIWVIFQNPQNFRYIASFLRSWTVTMFQESSKCTYHLKEWPPNNKVVNPWKKWVNTHKTFLALLLTVNWEKILAFLRYVDKNFKRLGVVRKEKGSKVHSEFFNNCLFLNGKSFNLTK